MNIDKTPHPDCATPATCCMTGVCRWPHCRDESKYHAEVGPITHAARTMGLLNPPPSEDCSK